MSEGEASRVATGSVALSVQSIVNTLLGLVFFIFLARLISQVEMGVYASLLLAMALFQTIGPLGLPVAAARFIPKSVGEGRSDQVSGCITSILLMSFVSAIGLSLALYLLAYPFSLFLTKSAESSTVFTLASLAVFLYIPAANLDAVMQGLQSFGKLAAVRVFAQALRVAVSVLLLMTGYALSGVVWGFIAMNASSLLIFLYFVRSHLRNLHEIGVIARLLEYSFPLLLSNLANFLSSQTDLLVLMVLTIPVLVGSYNVAVTVSGLLGIILIATVNATVQPAAAKVFGSSGKHGLELALRKTSRYLMLVYVPAAIGLAALGSTAVNIAAGPTYLDAAVPLAIISVASITSALCIMPTIALQTLGDTRSVLVLTISSVLAGLGTDVVLIPKFGGTGAALGRAALMIIGLLAGLYLARRHLSLNFDLQALRKAIVASGIMAIVLAQLQASLGFVPHYALLYILVGIVIFLVLMRIQHAFRAEDVDVLREILPSSLKGITKLVTWVTS